MSKISGLNCNLVTILCEHETSVNLTFQLNFSICVWRNLVFQIVGRYHGWSLYVGPWRNTTVLTLFFWLVKSFKKLVNNRLADHLEKCGLFSNLQYGFRSSADLLTVVSDRTARVFNRSEATRAAALDTFKDFDRVWHAGVLLMEFRLRFLVLHFSCYTLMSFLMLCLI